MTRIDRWNRLVEMLRGRGWVSERRLVFELLRDWRPGETPSVTAEDIHEAAEQGVILRRRRFVLWGAWLVSEKRGS